MRVHRLGVQKIKRAKFEEKKGCVFDHIDKFGKDMLDKLRKMHAKMRI